MLVITTPTHQKHTLQRNKHLTDALEHTHAHTQQQDFRSGQTAFVLILSPLWVFIPHPLAFKTFESSIRAGTQTWKPEKPHFL